MDTNGDELRVETCEEGSLETVYFDKCEWMFWKILK